MFFCLQYHNITIKKYRKKYDFVFQITKFINKQIDDGKISDAQSLIEMARDSMRLSEKVAAHFTSMMEKKPYLVNFIQN